MSDLPICDIEDEQGVVIEDLEKLITVMRRAIDLVLPLMKRYEGQGEGGTTEFNIAMQALEEAARNVTASGLVSDIEKWNTLCNQANGGL